MWLDSLRCATIRHLAPIVGLALLLAANLPGSTWAAGAFNRTLSLQGYSFNVKPTGGERQICYNLQEG